LGVGVEGSSDSRPVNQTCRGSAGSLSSLSKYDYSVETLMSGFFTSPYPVL